MISVIFIIGLYMYHTSSEIQNQEKKLDYMMDIVTCVSEQMQNAEATTSSHGGAISENHPAEETDEFRLLNVTVAHNDEYGSGLDNVIDHDNDIEDDLDTDNDIDIDTDNDDDLDTDNDSDLDTDNDNDDDDESLNDSNRVVLLPDSLVEISEEVIPDTETTADKADDVDVEDEDVKIEEDGEVGVVTDYQKMSIVDLRKMYKSQNPDATDVGKMKKTDIIAFFNTPVVELNAEASCDFASSALDDEVY